jgi:hypothetical protein
MNGLPQSIANSDLKPSDIPDPDAEWTEIWIFALSFNGYEHWGSFEVCGAIANERRDQTLTDLRTCLFFEQRRWRHFGDYPDGEDSLYIRNIVREIHTRLLLGQVA